MGYLINQEFIKFNRCKLPLTAKGIVLHETATPNATALNEFDYFNRADRNASAHAFVDCKEIIQTLPWGEIAGHAGHTANNNFIGIELCHFKDKTKFNAIWKSSTWLFAHVFVNVLKIKTVTKNNLMSHAEVSAKWNESTHTDPISYFNQFNKTVDGFRADVQKQIDLMISPKFVVIVTGKKNDSQRVRTIQLSLNKLGYKYNNKPLIVDGIYGIITKDLVTKFQKDNNLGLKRLGEVGQITWDALTKK